MAAKKKSNSALTRQLNAAHKARDVGRWEQAIANYSKALAHKSLPATLKIELLEGRSACYKQAGDVKAAALDLKALSKLLKTQLEENSKALHQSQAENGIIAGIAEALVDQADYESIGRLVGQKVQEFFKAEIAGVAFYNDKSDMLDVVYYYDRGELKQVPSFRYGQGVTSYVIRTRKPLYIATEKDSKKYGAIYTEELPSKSALYAPLISGKRALGVISIQDTKPNVYSKHDLHILKTIASSMSVALENARFFDETNQRNAELAVINSVQQGLASRLKFQEIVDLVGEKVGEIFKADTVSAGMYDAQRDWWLNAYYVDRGRRVHIADGPVPRPSLGAVLGDTRQPLLLGTKEESEKWGAIRIPRSEDEGDQNESYLGVPILAGENLIGVISVQSYQKNAFNQNDLHLLQTIANSMSVALENARLFDETAQRNAELAVINSVQEAMAKQLDIKSIYEAVGEKIREIFDAQAMVLGRFDHAANLVVPHYFYEKGERFYPDPWPFSGEITHLISTRETIVINENFDAKAKEFGMIVHAGEMSKSAVFVPLVAGDKVIGGITLQNMDRENAFGQSDIRLLETLANSMSVALENARLFDETAQRNAELAVINSVQEALAKELNIQGIYEAVGEKIREIFDAQGVALFIYDPQTDMVHAPYLIEKGKRLEAELPLPLGGFSAQVKKTGKSILVNKNFAEKAREVGSRLIGEGGHWPKSYANAPIQFQGKYGGSIVIENIDRERAFSESDLRLLETLANSMSVALENARLFDESNRLLEETQEKAAELSTINTVGQALVSELELDSLIELIGDQVRQIFKADIAHLALYNKGKDLIEFPYSFGESLPPLKMGEGVVSRVIQEAKPVLINRDKAWKETEQKIERVGIKSLSYLGVPILSGKSAIGALSVQSTQKAGRFDEADVHLLSTIAANIGVAIRKAQLFEEVESRKQYFEALFTNSPVAVVATDFGGKVISWNPAAEALFGYTLEEAVGRDLDDLVARDPLVEAEARGFSRRYQAELSGIRARTKRTRKDGSLVDVELMGLPVTVDGENVGFLAIYHDISEIEQARRAAEEANQAKSAFLANMSHELRTPLNAIIGFTRIVKRKGAEVLPEKQTENLDKVLISAEHLLGLINTILDIAKIEAGRMEVQLSDFNLDALVDSCLATTQPLVRTDRVKLVKSLPRNLPQMHSDQEKIRQILLNLMSNAAKFTHEGSIKVDGKLKDEMIALSVQDSGIGIAEENLHKIFEEFQQADNTTTREYGGTGLGLSISRSLARLLGGDLTVASEAGEGSTFSLTIPLRLGKVGPGPRDGSQEIAAVAKAVEQDKPLVLVIDDQPDMFHIMQQNLEGAGYEVEGALSGEEGIEKARALRPYAITLDIMMPHMDGWQVLYELKNDPKTKDIPVIILTIVDKKAMGFRLGASDYLVKPLNEKSVLEALDRLAKSNGGVRPRRLLVVDDDPKVIDLLRQMLEEEDFIIETAKDGAEALKLTEQRQPDAILLDLIMPKLDGFQFIEEMQKIPKLRAIPIIVLTAKSLSNEELSQLKKGVAKIVKKQGLGTEALIKEIHKIVA